MALALRGLKVIIAGAGGAAHLPGMLAAATTLPVIGVPVALARLDGLDSLLSIVQMPRGVPVATVAINGAANAGLLALRILATEDQQLAEQLENYRVELATEVSTQNLNLRGPRPDDRFTQKLDFGTCEYLVSREYFQTVGSNLDKYH